MVKCGLCGKEHEGWESYYLARRSDAVMKIGLAPNTWDYFGVAPVFFACSQEHYNILLRELVARHASANAPLLEKIDPAADFDLKGGGDEQQQQR